MVPKFQILIPIQCLLTLLVLDLFISKGVYFFATYTLIEYERLGISMNVTTHTHVGTISMHLGSAYGSPMHAHFCRACVSQVALNVN